MLNQLKQVAICHVTRPFHLIWNAISFLCLSGWILYGSLHPNINFIKTTRVDFPVVFCCLVCITLLHFFHNQALWQFAHPRSRLTPNFARPHLIVLVACTLAWGVGWPVLHYLVFGSSLLHVLTVISVLLALSCPAITKIRFYLYWALFLVFLARDRTNSPTWEQIEIGLDLLSPYLLIASLAVNIYWLKRLTQTNEADPYYKKATNYYEGDSLNYQGSNARKVKPTVLQKPPFIVWLSHFWGQWNLDNQLQKLSLQSPLRSKIRASSQASSSWNSAIVIALSMLGLLGLLFATKQTDDLEEMKKYAILFSVLTTITCPIMACIQLRFRLNNYAAVQLLPMTRRQYINNLLNITITDTLGWWMIVHTGIGVFLFAIGGLTEPLTVAVYVFLALTIQCATFTVSLLFVTLKFWSTLAVSISVITAITLILTLVEPWWNFHLRHGHGGYLLGALAILTLSIPTILVLRSTLMERRFD